MQYTVYAINNLTGSTENWKSFADKKEAKKYFQQLLSQTTHNIYLCQQPRPLERGLQKPS